MVQLLKTKRINLIRDYVLENDSVSLDDIQLLVESGELTKVYGGVAYNQQVSGEKQIIEAEDQPINKIAKTAADFIEDGDTIFVDSGSNAVDLLHFLKEKQLTVVTNNLGFIIEALTFENLTVISIGGILDRKTKSFTTLGKGNELDFYHINKAFMDPKGVSITRGVTHSTPHENDLKKAAVKKSAEIYLLAEHQKFDKYALMTFCNLDSIDYLITDQPPTEKYVEFAEEHKIQIVVAQ
jgi:DeoR family myo-inositol catabolism operon transcriptional repressor